MIDTPDYKNSELIQQVREEYGTNGTTVKRAAEPASGVQNRIRLAKPAGRQPGEAAGKQRSRPAGSKGPDGSANGAAEGGHRRKGRTSPTLIKISGGNREGDGTIDREIPDSGVEHAEQEKPAGLDARPNARERQIREEQERERQAAEAAEAKKSKGLFGWIRPDHRTGEKGKEQTRGKPLNAAEAAELKAPLIAALGDYFTYADELLYAIIKSHPSVTIWRSIDDEQIEKLADVWLARARRSAAAASRVTFLVQKHQELEIAMILLPKFYETFRAIVDGGGIGVK